VVIAGDEGHGEVIGLVGHAPGAIVISNAQCARALHLDRNVALVAQTTISQSELDAIRDALAARTTVIDAGGVCGATTERQSALLAVLPQVDAVVVVGGKDSANTRRLAALASQAGKPVWLVGTATDVPDDVGRFAKVGLSAGASTPDSDIDAVERRLLELGQA
jgi:4-hydroxy-3-methylbut-2-enyl diphosphate reductase